MTRADISIYLGGGLRDHYETVAVGCSTHFGKTRRRSYACLSQTPNLPLFAIVSAIFFKPKSSRVFRVGQPWAVSQPSNL